MKYTLKSNKDNKVVIETNFILVANNYIGLESYRYTHYIKITKDKIKYNFDMFQDYVKKHKSEWKNL